jgi:pullulanase
MKQNPGITIHYHRYHSDYESWTLWIWKSGDAPEPLELKPSGQDSFGFVFQLDASYGASTSTLGFLPKFKDWEQQDGPDRILTDLSVSDVYILQGDSELYHEEPLRTPRIRSAYLDSVTELNIVINTAVPVETVSPGTLDISDHETGYEPSDIIPHASGNGMSAVFTVKLGNPVAPENVRQGMVSVQLQDTPAVSVIPRYVFDNPHFIFDGWLGPRVTQERTVFRVWAPAAAGISVVMNSSLPLPAPDDPAGDRSSPMKYIGSGVWELQRDGDYRNWFYRFDSTLASSPEQAIPVYDPYARAIDRKHRACVLIDDETPVTSSPDFPFSDAIICELHVRDFTTDESSGSPAKGIFPGLHACGTRYPRNLSVKTGCDHLLELGVNTLQLMPVHAFKIDGHEGEYQWGYMTEHFNAPEPGYASDDNGVTAVRELKQAIDALHRLGFKVTLDVVYNHSTEGPDFACHFNGLAPGYFYRVKPDGSYWNGSGCGNEFRSEGPMAKKFLLDSLIYWVTEYGVDGFRFDLMGLIDRKTMDEIVTVLKTVKPGIFIYGEPWTGGDTPTEVTGKGAQKGKGFSCFNDSFRVAVSGGVFDTSPGYVFDGRNRNDVICGLKGSPDWFTLNPPESINYVECHDDRTLSDKLSLTAYEHFPAMPAETQFALNRLCAFLVLFAQGVPFLHLGQEFRCTKFGEHNTYNMGDEYNKIRWNQKQDNYRLFMYYRNLVNLRREHALFRLPETAAVKRRITVKHAESPFLALALDGRGIDDPWRNALMLVNPTGSSWRFHLPKSSRKWYVYVEKDNADTTPFHSTARPDYRVFPYSASLLAQLKHE